MKRATTLIKGLSALGLLLGLTGAVPWALLHYIGWPLPHGVPSWAQFTTALNQHGIPDETLLKALACVVWIAWAILIASLLVELPAAVRGTTARHLGITGPIQPVVGHLLAAVIVAAIAVVPRPASPARPLAAASGLARPRGPVVTMALAADVQPRVPAPIETALSDGPPATETSQAETVYIVQRNDTLWGIAEHELGDPLRWSEIYNLNQGRAQPDGRTLDDPHWIYPGWTLLLPEPSAATPSTPASSLIPSPTPSPDGTVPRPAAGATSHNGASAGQNAHPTSRGATSSWVALASGSRLGASFAAGVISALVAVRLRRRQSYCPRTPRPGRCVGVPKHSAALRDLIDTVRASRGTDDELSEHDSEPPRPLTQVPDAEALLRPDVIEVASRADEAVRIGMCDWPGLVVTGPGADAALRAWVATLVTRNGPYGAEIVIPDHMYAALLGDLVLPSVRRADNTEAAIERLETTIIGRRRQLEEADVDDAVAYRERFPEDPLPMILAVLDVIPDHLATRLRQVNAVGSVLGLATIVMTPTPTESSTVSDPILAVDAHGTVQEARPTALSEHLVDARLFQVGSSEVVELLTPVAAVHAAPVPMVARFNSEHGGNGSHPASVHGAEDIDVEFAAAATVVDDIWPAPARTTKDPAPIQVRVLGPRRIEAFGKVIESGFRASAYELLAWYLLRPEGATSEAAIDALWPNDSPERGREHFWTAVGNLRSRLRRPGDESIDVLPRVGDHYRPDPALLDADLWRFEAALTDAVRATEPTEASAALESAIAAYGGDFCPNADGIWIEPVREDLHRRALDACVRLADLRIADDQCGAAVGALERAIEIDDICEEAYRRLIDLQVRLGHRDGAVRAWRRLQGRLAELDLDPEPVTETLVRQALSSLAPEGRSRADR